MELEGTLMHSQKLTIGLYPKPSESSLPH